MALKLNERYPGRYNNPSADYPQGSFKNRTSPTAKDGSYLEQDWANDKEGFFQSLISVAGVVPSGSADKVGASQYYDALLTVLYAAARKTPILDDTGTANVYAAVNTPALTALPATGYMQRVKIANLNTGASTYAPDGLTAKPIYGLGLQPLQGGELPVGVAVLMYLVQAGVNGGNGAWIVIESLGGASQIASATKSQHAVQLGQVQQNYAWNHQLVVISATGNFTVPSGVYFLDVEIWSAGGAGGGTGTVSQTAGGGGGGGYARSIIPVTPGQVISATVGAGGAAVSGSAGGNGGASSFGPYMSITGGGGGQPNPTGSGGAGGVPTGGTISLTGGGGGAGIGTTNGGSGGGSPFGGVGGVGGTTVPSAGAGPGAGGGGRGGGSTGAGGNGLPGSIIIRY